MSSATKVGEQADGERDAAGDERAGQEIAAVGVGAEQEAAAARRRAVDASAVRSPSALSTTRRPEEVGAVEIADDALVDRLVVGDMTMMTRSSPSSVTSCDGRRARARMASCQRRLDLLLAADRPRGSAGRCT